MKFQFNIDLTDKDYTDFNVFCAAASVGISAESIISGTLLLNAPPLIHINKGEKMISDSGAMAWMDPCMKMETNGGGAGKIIGRMFSGETLFRNSYTANKDGLIAFASSFPGKIVAIDVEPGKEVIIQKSAFLASEENVETSVCFNKKFSSGIFGGEGFILTKISGHGTCFIEIDGSTVEYNLLPGQQLIPVILQ